MVIEQIDVHFDEDEGHLRLDCDDEGFGHIRDLIVSEASADDRLGRYADGIRSIVVRHRAAIQDKKAGGPAGWLRIALIALALTASLAIQIVGLVAITRWLWQPGP